MSETRLTPARRAELARLYEALPTHPSVKRTLRNKRSDALHEALAEVDRLTARWEALKVWLDARYEAETEPVRKAEQDCIAAQMTIVTRLEQEP